MAFRERGPAFPIGVFHGLDLFVRHERLEFAGVFEQFRLAVPAIHFFKRFDNGLALGFGSSMPHCISQHLVGNIHRRLHEGTFTEFGISVNYESDEIIFLISISWSPPWLPNLHFDGTRMCELARPSLATTEHGSLAPSFAEATAWLEDESTPLGQAKKQFFRSADRRATDPTTASVSNHRS